MNDITLVVAGADDAVERVQQHMSNWARHGLLRPFLWWHAPGATGHLVRANGCDEPQLMLEAIGDQEYATVRLVSLVVAPRAGSAVDVDIREVATEVEEAIAARLGAAQRLARVNLIVPASRIAGLPAALLNSYWDLNLVAADEDR